MVEYWHWHTEPALLIGILFVSWCYFNLVGPWREKLSGPSLFPKREAIYFAVGVVSFYVAVGSPLDAAGEGFLFSAHMVQHNILMYITPILTLIAIPAWLFDRLMLKSNRWLGTFVRFMTKPLVAGFTFTLVFSGWHFPVLYEAALHSKVIHMVEHLTMYGASCLMIWPILGKSNILPRMNYGVQVLYLALLMIAQIPLFGILTFSTEVLYPTYELAPRLIEFLDPLADQVLGGLIMKVANMLFSLTFMIIAFIKWNEEAA